MHSKFRKKIKLLLYFVFGKEKMKIIKLLFHLVFGKVEKNIPEIPLAEKHMKNCTLLLNRKAMLSKLPQKANVAEIGVDKGKFSQSILQLTNPQKMHLVDIWDSERYSPRLYKEVQIKFAKEIRTNQVQIHRKLSIAAITDFPDKYFDWIYLDTSHSYHLTKIELEKYAPKMKTAGIIAGHDYTLGN